MEKLLIATLIMAIFPFALVAFMSFVIWGNAFKELGVRYIARMSVITAAIPVITHFVSGGRL